MEYEELLEKANRELKKVIDFLKENKSAFDYMDLKCHDVSYYCWKDMEKDFPLCYACAEDNDYFSWFCEAEYDCFIEWCKENNIDFNKMRCQLGRTSSFYLQDFTDTNIDYTLENLYEKVSNYCGFAYVYIDGGNILRDDFEEYKDETIEELEYIADEFYNDVISYCKDILKVYDYINSFKENQVEIFKEYLEGYEETIRYEKEREEKEKAQSRDKCISIQNKYNITDEDMQVLKENIFCL